MTQNEIYASALQIILEVIDFDKDETDTCAMGVMLVSIRDAAQGALTDGLGAHRRAMKIENARRRALAI